MSSLSSDPAVKAAEELSLFLSSMEVPCAVVVNEAKGKHVTATAAIAAEVELLEEVPLVSWPSADLIDIAQCSRSTQGDATAVTEVPETTSASSFLCFCFHCLACEWCPSTSTTNDDDSKQFPWQHCPGCESNFCGEACVKAARTTHALLCPHLAVLRGMVEKEEEEEEEEERGVSDRVAAAGRRRCPGQTCSFGPRVITREALARCVATVVHKIRRTMHTHELTPAMLQDDFARAREGADEGKPAAMLVAQLFHSATAPFNHLVSTADAIDFDGIDFAHAWVPALGYHLFERGKAILLEDVTATDDGLPLCPGVATRGSMKGVELDEAARDREAAAMARFVLPTEATTWTEEVMLGLLDPRTLHTLLGQLVLNAHAVTDLTLFLTGGPHPRDEEKWCGEGVPGEETPIKFPSASSSSVRPFSIKGAGIYSILSAFNHSCEPNLAIYNAKVPPDGSGEAATRGTALRTTNHEILLKTIKNITTGEEVCLTYIPLALHDTVVERRAQLEGYFFKCHCPRCVREEEEEKHRVMA